MKLEINAILTHDDVSVTKTYGFVVPIEPQDQTARETLANLVMNCVDMEDLTNRLLKELCDKLALTAKPTLDTEAKE